MEEKEELKTLENRINQLLTTIKSDKTQDIQKVVLSRSLIEQYSILNFLKEDPNLIEEKINRFKAFEYLEVFLKNVAKNIESPKILIENIKEHNKKFGGQVDIYIKESLPKGTDIDNNIYETFLKMLRQNKVSFVFPYKNFSGSNSSRISDLVTNYSGFNKDDIKIWYGALADLSHGTLLTATNVYKLVAKPIVDQISQKISN